MLVYSCGSHYLPKLNDAFKNEPHDDTAKQLVDYIKEIDHDCVVFNWECSSGYDAEHFTEGANELFKFLKLIIDRGHIHGHV